MWKRLLSGTMWLFLIVWAWNYGAWLFGLPEALGPVIGVVVALLVGVDPLGLLFARTEPVASHRTATLAQELRGGG